MTLPVVDVGNFIDVGRRERIGGWCIMKAWSAFAVRGNDVLIG